ncbi:hypothetical protein BDV19DRAFT_363675 [Aspergillus venezuelensis]
MLGDHPILSLRHCSLPPAGASQLQELVSTIYSLQPTDLYMLLTSIINRHNEST